MQLESLEVFCDVVRLRSFSLAASEGTRKRTQSAVSQIVAQLEDRLEVKLIDRSTRPLQMTPAGKTFYDGCRRILEQFTELESAVRNSASEMTTRLRVAAIYSVGLGDMHEFVERFEHLFPHTRVHMEYLHPSKVYEEVELGVADFGLVSFPKKSTRIGVIPWREEEMMVVCSPRHTLSRESSIRPAQLNGMKYVSFDKGLVIRKEVDRFLREQNVTVEMTVEFDNIETIKKAIEIEGVALLPEPTVRREVEAQSLVCIPLEGCRMTRPLGIIHRKHTPLSNNASRFLEMLKRNGEPDEAPEAPPRVIRPHSPGTNGSTGNHHAR